MARVGMGVVWRLEDQCIEKCCILDCYGRRRCI